MKKLLLAAALIAATTGCSTIGREAGQVTVIDDNTQLYFVKDCRNIGNVVVEAGGMTRRGEHRNGYVALREAAVDAGGDTVMVTATDKRFMSKFKIYGRVYDCRIGA